MNWNAKPENVTLPPQYPKKQSSFLEQALINTVNTTSQSSLNYSGSNQEACMFLGNSNPISQPLLNIRNYTAPQQIPFPDMHNGTLVASQTSVERITYANVKGSKQLNHNLQMSSGVTQNVWLNSPMKNPVLSHTGATMSHQTGFGTNTPNIHALQNQFVTSDSYSMQLQMIPSNSLRVPTYQGPPRLNPSLSERQVDWSQQYTSSGLTYSDYRPVPKQYSYSSQSFLQDPTLQKQNSMPSTLHIKNGHPPDSPRTLQSKQTAAMQSYQYTVTQIDKRLPPPPYDCRYTSQPLLSTQHVIKQASVDIPQSQEMHLPEMRKDYSRSFQQNWQNLNENTSTSGNFCNVKVNTSVTQPINEPVRSSVDGVQTLTQNNQERRVDCDPTSNQVIDTSSTKEKLLRDIKTLVEIKKKFSELARKIKINKNLLMAAGCIKTTDSSYTQLAPNSKLSLKQTAQIQRGPQVTLVTPEDKPPTGIQSAKETNRTHSTMNSSIQDPNWGNCNQVNSVPLSSAYSEKLPMPDQLHDLKVRTSLKASTVESTQATLNNTQISSGNVSVELNVPTNAEATSVPQSTSFEEYISKYPNKNTLILSLLTCTDKHQEKLLKNNSEAIEGSEPHSFEINPNTQITGNQTLKTMETPSTCKINATVLDNSFCLEHKSSTSGMSSKSDSHFSMELLATCLSLWKKQPSESTEEKQYNDSKNRTAVGVSKPLETCDKSPFSVVGNSHHKTINTSQETTLSTVVQNYESSGASVTKGTELQVAVVSPLILSDVKTLSAKGITPEPVPETLYPVIKEGSVCSLKNDLAENISVTAALVHSNEPVGGTTTDIKMFSPIQKEEQSESNSEDTPNNNQEKHIKSETDTHYSMGEQQASYKSRNSDNVSGDTLHIDNICSLVEGDTSYNSQIAKIFNLSYLKSVEPQKCLPNHQVITKGQKKEQIDSLTENKDFGSQNDNFLQCPDVSHKITDQAESLQPEESSLKYVKADNGILEDSNLDHITKKESTTNDTCSLSAIQQDSCPQKVDTLGNYTAQDPERSEILSDKASVLYLHDQLSELLKEFPYGIESVNRHEVSVAQQITDQSLKDKTCDETGCNSKDSTDQIQITVLNSEQMKELFPEHDDQLCEVDKLMEHQKEEPIKKEGSSQCDPQANTDERTDYTLMDSEKDDVGCCALGWLSMVYEGVPQCQCSSVDNSISKEEKGENQCSPSKINSCKQGERTDRNDPVQCSSPLSNSPKIPLTFPDPKKHFPEIEQDKNKNDKPKTKHQKSMRREQELSGQFLSKTDKKLESLQSHKRKRKLQFHEITFHNSNKTTKFSQESLHQKLMAQNFRPIKPKVGFLTNRDLRMKNGSLVQSVSPEKIKLKGGLKQNFLEKRKLDEGSILDSKIKRKNYDKREQNKSVGDGTFKLCNFLSIPNERARVKEKTVSNVKSSVPKDSSSKFNRVLTPKEYLQRQKHKDAVGSNASKKSYVRNVPCDSQYIKSSKLSMQVGSCGKSSERQNSSVHTSNESPNICSNHGKNLKTHHSEESKTHISRHVKGIVGGKQPDKMWIDKTKLNYSSSMNSEVEFTQMPPQSKDQRKLYLNRVAFKCTERESICLTKLDSSPRKPNKERRLESKPQRPVKDDTQKPSMLEFKLCPDGLIKNTDSVRDWKDLQPDPRKEQAPVQVSGIKSTKEDWLRSVTEEKRMPEASQEIDNVSANSRLSKRSFSADGFETLQNPVKDSKTMFQTYKKMYMEKRSRSLGSSPLK